MKPVSRFILVAACLAALAGCSSSNTGASNGKSSGAGGSAGGSTGSSTAGTTAGTGNGSANGSGNGNTSTNSSGGSNTGSSGLTTSGTSCVNLQCQVQSCPNSGHTQITGTIMDPAGKDPLYNVVAYIPNSTVQPLSAGASCDSCNSLFSGEPMAAALSDDSGKFTINDAPVGANIPLVVQVGKWRTHITIPNVPACSTTDVGAVSLPTKMDASDPIINLPDIAISTGSADSLECLLVRVGIDPSEYVAGDSSAGRVHIFSGGKSTSGGGGGGSVGKPESNVMNGAPESSTSLWNSQSNLMKYDIVLLSCEGGETYNAVPANLEGYLNAGGRVFASHFHYSWFSGPLQTTQSYAAPGDWGDNLATWTGGSNGANSANGKIVTTLFNGNAFPKGQALASWLGNVNALGTSGAPSNELYIKAPRENASVQASNTPSQPWINDTNSTLYFSFDTPVVTDGGTPPGGQFCGRAVFSGLHVGAASFDGVNCGGGGGSSQGCNTGHVAAAPPPTGCDTQHDLSPQEKALEFMLFDLSSCVVPDNVNPITDGGIGDGGIIFN